MNMLELYLVMEERMSTGAIDADWLELPACGQ